ncbi:MAG: virulence factor TspB C-terminal domain-related protein [Alcanivorax sp.]
MDHQDFVGDEEYLEGPSITSTEDADGDGQPDNAIPTASLDAGTVVAGLSEDTISFGNLACPADKTFSMPGAFGGSFTLSWEPICDWAAMVRPIVIALGYLMSALIILRKFSGGSE